MPRVVGPLRLSHASSPSRPLAPAGRMPGHESLYPHFSTIVGRMADRAHVDHRRDLRDSHAHLRSAEMTIFIPTLAAAFAAFCVWLTVRIVNRRAVGDSNGNSYGRALFPRIDFRRSGKTH